LKLNKRHDHFYPCWVCHESKIRLSSLEPAGPSTATANQDKRIPEGVYNIDSYSSTKFPDNFLLSNKDVSKSSLIFLPPLVASGKQHAAVAYAAQPVREAYQQPK